MEDVILAVQSRASTSFVPAPSQDVSLQRSVSGYNHLGLDLASWRSPTPPAQLLPCHSP